MDIKKFFIEHFIPLEKANKIHYGHQNDTLQQAYIRGRNEILNELLKFKKR